MNIFSRSLLTMNFVKDFLDYFVIAYRILFSYMLYNFQSPTLSCISRSISILSPNKSTLNYKGTWVFLAFGLTSFMLLVLIHYRLRRKFVERTQSNESWFKSCLIISVMNCCAYGQMGAFAMSVSSEEFFV